MEIIFCYVTESTENLTELWSGLRLEDLAILLCVWIAYDQSGFVI